MLVTGNILFDKEKIIPKLLNEAKEWMKKPLKPSKRIIETQKYHVWDLEDNLKSTYDSNEPDFIFVYHNMLQELYDIYCEYLQETKNRPHKTHTFLTNEDKRKDYLKKEFPDKIFAKLFSKAVQETSKEQMLSHYKKLTKHVLKKMGDFNIDGWKIRSKI